MDNGTKILAYIWHQVVGPVIREIGLVVCQFAYSDYDITTDYLKQKQSGRKRPRIHWCPTGPFAFFPLHAAYGADTTGAGCSDYCVSSYTPTITALLNTRNSPPDVATAFRALLVAEDFSPGLNLLDNTREEITAVSACLVSMNPIVIGDSISASEGAQIQDVIDKLPQASLLHLACHGEQDLDDPLNSGFGLRDGRLTVAELMRLDLKNAQFAYLSACETAKGDAGQPDQSVHLAATMLFVGFRSVVATMWYEKFTMANQSEINILIMYST